MPKFIFLSILIFATFAQAQTPTCLGRGNPQNDFYAKDLANKVSEANDLNRDISRHYDQIREQQKQVFELEKPLVKKLDTAAKEKNNQDRVRQKLLENYNPNDPKQVAPFAVVNSVFSEKEFKTAKGFKELQKKIKEHYETIDLLKGEAKSLEYQRDHGFYRFINKWQKDLKAKGDATEGQACIDCGIHKIINSFGDTLTKIFSPHISENCVEQSIINKTAPSPEILCTDAKSSGRVSSVAGGQCVTKDLSNYIHWSLNQAIDCLGSAEHPIDPNILALKLNNESTFRFYKSYVGGHGIMQTIKCSDEEMLGRSPSRYCGDSTNYDTTRSAGRKFLAKIMSANGHKCDIYNGIFNFKKERSLDLQAQLITTLRTIDIAKPNDIDFLKKSYQSELQELKKTNDSHTLTDDISGALNALNDYPKFSEKDKNTLSSLAKKENERFQNEKKKYPAYDKKLFDPQQQNNCQFISLEEGIHRNILTGIGLFLYYRDGYYNGDNDGSAKDILNDLGVTPKNSADYIKKLNYTALAMYGSDGDSGAAQKILSHSNEFLTRNKRGHIIATTKDLNSKDFFAALKKVMKPPHDKNDPGYIGSVEQSKKEAYKDGALQCTEN